MTNRTEHATDTQTLLKPSDTWNSDRIVFFNMAHIYFEKKFKYTLKAAGVYLKKKRNYSKKQCPKITFREFEAEHQPDNWKFLGWHLRVSTSIFGKIWNLPVDIQFGYMRFSNGYSNTKIMWWTLESLHFDYSESFNHEYEDKKYCYMRVPSA